MCPGPRSSDHKRTDLCSVSLGSRKVKTFGARLEIQKEYERRHMYVCCKDRCKYDPKERFSSAVGHTAMQPVSAEGAIVPPAQN